jgi:hypothetical protein
MAKLFMREDYTDRHGKHESDVIDYGVLLKKVALWQQACDISFRGTFRITYWQTTEHAEDTRSQHAIADFHKPAGTPIWRPEKTSLSYTEQFYSPEELKGILEKYHRNVHILPPGGNYLEDFKIGVADQSCRAKRSWLKKTETSILSVRLFDDYKRDSSYHGLPWCAAEPYKIWIDIEGEGTGVHLDRTLGIKTAPK